MKPLSIVAVRGTAGGARLLETCGPARRSNMRLLTPAPILYTKGASIPHITHEVFEMITKDEYMFHVPLLTTLQMKVGTDVQGKGLGIFSGLGESPTFMTFQDPCVVVPQAHMDKYNMPLWSRMGKKMFDSDMYMDVVESFKPDMYQVLSDGCTDAASSKKRGLKSTERSKVMFSKCLERHKGSEYLLKNSSVFGAIEGGYCIDQRKESLDHILSEVEHLSGFVLDGFDSNGPNIENIMYDSIKEIVEAVTNKLPDDKLRIVNGCWNAVTLIDLVSAGWDLFDSSMPFLVTERGCALTFSISADDVSNNAYEINLKEDRYIEDFNPISSTCKCLTCTKHSKAYINHLINTKELLSGVLLMIHNLYHYMEFFKAIRNHIETNRLHKLRTLISGQHFEHIKSCTSEVSDDEVSKKKHRRL
ncbi:queuine tRNA-ribosyltransferase accessory subunit 2 [Arctopsyche grandis]|uniref:queuine tRNA-ribosyltransferase accessory subunit 2 n=1 Tax=Arctopsyche grandis TaxID=121162 RepID=UPI00406D6D4E